MAKSKLSKAADSAKTIAGAALGAAAIAATGVVVTRVANAIQHGGKQLEEATPALQKMAAETVAEPLLPKNSKRNIRGKARSPKMKAGRTREARRVAGKRTSGKGRAGKRTSHR